VLPSFCNCPDDAVPCCEDLYTIAGEILDAAWGALVACAGADCCAPIYHFVAVAEPHLMVQDYLTVWMDTMQRLPNQAQQMRTLQFGSTQGTYNIKLMESGYPTLETVGTQIHEPTTDALNFAARHSLAHGEAVYRGVLEHVERYTTCGSLKSFGDLAPIGPSGGSVGWGFSVTIEL
jgi:hypothetical protein